MRASFQKDLTIQDRYQLKGDVAHHLLSVVRIEAQEEILLLNGQGLVVKTVVSAVTKREVSLDKIEAAQRQRSFEMELALGIPKKEALELALKQAVELGFSKIYLLRSQYSQTKVPEADRLENVLVSALEQSNAPFLPEVIETTWNEIPYKKFEQVLLMDSQHESRGNILSRTGNKLLIVGPEGGFSPKESKFLHQISNLRVLNLPTPILRTPTAVATGAGIILGTLLDQI